MDLVLWGAAGHAKVLNECVQNSDYRVVAVFDNNPECTSPIEGVPVFHGWNGFTAWRETMTEPTACQAAIGGAAGKDRADILARMAEAGLKPVTLIHRTAFVAGDATIGNASQILAQASVCANAELGECCIVNTGANVDHECRLGPGVHLAPGAVLCGCVTIEENTMIGAGAVVLPRINIGAHAVIGAGAVVTRDVPAGAVVIGNPARPINPEKE